MPQTSGWLEQGRTNAQAGAIGNAKVIEALFKPEILAGKRATEAIEAAQNVMIVARVVESKPASQRPFEDARAEITKRLIDREAQALARKAGADRLAELRKNPNAAAATTKWGPARSVSREDPQGLPREAVAAVFKADTATLPVFVGIETPGGAGYSVYRIAKVTRPVTDDKRAGEMSDQLARLDARDQSQAFIGGLRERGKVEVNRATLEKRAPQ